MKIPLTCGLAMEVDEDDFDYLSQWKWHVHKKRGNGSWYACRTEGRKVIMAHRQILHIACGDNAEVDHINGNGLDNRKCNLRKADRSQNQCNSPKRRGTQFRYKGILRTKYGRYIACVIKNKRKHYFGHYKTEEDAAKAYDQGAKLLHGEFANLNFP